MDLTRTTLRGRSGAATGSPARPGSSADGAERPARSPAAAGALAATATVGVGLVICMAAGLIGWFLADAGAHGDTTDALRVGAAAWLLGHGADLSVGGVPVGITPLALSAGLALTAFRCGRWAGRGARPAPDRTAAPGAGHGWGQAVLVCVATYVVLVVLVAALVTHADTAPSIPRAILGALLFAAIPCGLGLAAGTGRLAAWWTLVPGWVRSVGTGALAGLLLLVAAGAVLVAVGLALSFNEAAGVFSALRLSVGDALMLLVVSALVAPNAALFAVSYLSGPGFAVGTGTTVTAASVTLGPVPAFPLLAAVPGDGPAPGWLAVLYAVPAVCAFVGAAVAQRRYAVPAWDSSALRGFGVGLGAGVATTVLAGLAGGPMGTGRMADIGVPFGELLVTAVGGMSIGGLLGGLAVAAWQHRQKHRQHHRQQHRPANGAETDR